MTTQQTRDDGNGEGKEYWESPQTGAAARILGVFGGLADSLLGRKYTVQGVEHSLYDCNYGCDDDPDISVQFFDVQPYKPGSSRTNQVSKPLRS